MPEPPIKVMRLFGALNSIQFTKPGIKKLLYALTKSTNLSGCKRELFFEIITITSQTIY